MTPKIALVTGANSGIGFETAKELAIQGYYVVMVCRNSNKAANSAIRNFAQNYLDKYESRQRLMQLTQNITNV